MGTFVSAEIVGDPTPETDAVITRALGWFDAVEAVCTRFNPASELMQLTEHAGEAVPVSAMLFEAVRFALEVADASGGAFDPTVGAAMEARGVNREHRTRRTIHTGLPTAAAGASYRDIVLDESTRTIMLTRPLILDLGAVAKGMAVDMAAETLRPFENFAVNAGGDLYFGGVSPRGEPWSVGVRHPDGGDELIELLRVSDRAVCTSGNYERPHLVDPADGVAADACASVTVIAPTAMAADAIATAAFVLGPAEGLAFLESQGVEGLIVTPALERRATPGLAAFLPESRRAHAPIAPV
jgi:thiamine biosynthesis lipoprotein